MIAYLATSAFGHLYRKINCTAADIGGLRKAIYDSKSAPEILARVEGFFEDRECGAGALAREL